MPADTTLSHDATCHLWSCANRCTQQMQKTHIRRNCDFCQEVQLCFHMRAEQIRLCWKEDMYLLCQMK